mgnify:CR=1 FL=1
MDINYPELLTAFYHYITYIHIKKAYKNQLPERSIEPATLQFFQKQGKFELNAITTWPRPCWKGLKI